MASKPECHPDKPYHCKGLCQQCYNRENYKRWAARPGNKERARKRAKDWLAANRERAKEQDYQRHTERKFGISRAEYDALLEAQGGVCAICKQPSVTGKRLHVDHDHKTEIVRGILCHHCNSGLGQFFDSVERLNDAAAYLLQERC